MPEKALITGGSGLVGRRLTELLIERGWQVAHLGRREHHDGVRTFQWDPSKGHLDAAAFEGVTGVVHLAGASIAGKRWTESYKREILNSRVESTRLLFNQLAANRGTIDKVVSASATGFYGSGPATRSLTENDSAGRGFLADVVREWESEALHIASLGIPVALVRTGIVLSDKGGALTQMARPVRFGVGAPLGSGEQIISWIHIDDLCRIYIHLLESKDEGPFNATAPAPVTNAALTKAIAKRLKKPLWLPPVPAFLLKLILGELADAVLTGSKVSSEKIVRSGFTFTFPDIETAIADLFEN